MRPCDNSENLNICWFKQRGMTGEYVERQRFWVQETHILSLLSVTEWAHWHEKGRISEIRPNLKRKVTGVYMTTLIYFYFLLNVLKINGHPLSLGYAVISRQPTSKTLLLLPICVAGHYVAWTLLTLSFDLLTYPLVAFFFPAYLYYFLLAVTLKCSESVH